MVARRDVRQRMGRDRLFQEGQTADGVTYHAPRPDQRAFGRIGGAQIGLIRTEADDIHIVPGAFAVRTAALQDFRSRVTSLGVTVGQEMPAGEGLVVVHLEFGPQVQLPVGDHDRATAGSHFVLQRLTAGVDGLPADRLQSFAPLYGFVAHQTSHPCDDPEETESRPGPPAGPEGAGIRVVIIDTGVWDGWAWRRAHTSGQANQVPDEYDELLSDSAQRTGTIGGPYLGRAAGHGTFIAGLVRQVVPSADITVLRSACTDGLVDEVAFADRVRRAADAQPDLVVICCGGTMYRLGDPPLVRPPSRSQNGEWLHPLVLEDAMAALLSAGSKPVVVMSAGNDGSSDHNYPAAFADPNTSAFAGQKDRLVSVAALDDEDWRAYFSNYGTWVTASTCGVRLLSTYVPGDEDQDDDPDGHAEHWAGANPWAMWSGTSFACPVVAGMIARTLWSLRAAGLPADAAHAWTVLRGQCAEGPDGDTTGLVVPAPMVARA